VGLKTPELPFMNTLNGKPAPLMISFLQDPQKNRYKILCEEKGVSI